MKKLQLTDTLDQHIEEQDPTIGSLVSVIKKVCEESGLDYVKINKALYQADKELYLKRLYM